MDINKSDNTLYHGSHTKLQIGDYLVPKISFDYTPYVYATDNMAYALIRSGKFNFKDIAIKEDYIGGKHILVELKRDAFKDIFDTKGYIYILNADDFLLAGDEFVSDKPIQIREMIYVDNVWDRMHSDWFKFHYDFVDYDHSDEYFIVNNINKEAYLARRRDRIKRLEELIK